MAAEYFHGLTKLDIARAHGVTFTQVDEWVRSGMPYDSTGEKMLFNLSDTIRWRMERTNGKNRLSIERARQAKENADHSSMRNAELRGELIRVTHVQEYWAQMVSSVRAKLLSLPRKLAPIARMTDTNAKCEAVLEATIYEALEELSSEGIPVNAGKFGKFNRGRDGQDSEPDESGSEIVASAAKTNRQSVGRRKKKTKRRGKR